VLALPNFVKPFILVTLLNNDKGPILQPSIILDRCKIKRNGIWLSEVLIQWKELPEEEATWEGEHEIQRLYPHFDLEDKVNFNGGGIDTNNNIMRSKNKNSQTMEKVKRSIRMGQRPKWLENYTC